jgi:quercetin dioxygenase-like cupin family protein
MALYWNVSDIQADDMSDNNIDSADRVAAKGHDMRLVHGNDCAFAVSLRRGGYHSSPHIHDYEQVNFIQEGEMWFYVHDQGFHLTAGDFLRIPRNAIHWSWVQTEQPCLCYEVFSPPPPKRPGRPDRKRGLFADDEEPVTGPSIGIYFVDLAFHGLDRAEIEARPAVNRAVVG